MTIDQPESKNYDVQYSIRLPQELLYEITKRAAIEGVKPSNWIRNSLMKLIQDKDEGNAESIKPALMYLLTSDPEVQRQIQQIASGARKKGEVSRVEVALTEYTALNDQSENLKKNLNRMDSDVSDLVLKYTNLRKKLREVESKIDILEKNFEKDAEDGKLKLILLEYKDAAARIHSDMRQTKDLIEKRKSEMLNYKMLLTDVTMRRNEILKEYNPDLSSRRRQEIRNQPDELLERINQELDEQ